MSDQVFIGTRAPRSLVEALDADAAKQKRSRSQLIVMLLDEKYGDPLPVRTYAIKDGVLDPDSMVES